MSSCYVGRCKSEAKWMNNDSNVFIMIRFSHSDTLSGSIVMSDMLKSVSVLACFMDIFADA